MIFIVDDDDSVRTSLVRLLRSAGMEASAYPSAEDFLRDAPDAGCACVLIDLHLPGMSGIELQRELLRRRVVPPVIMMTAFEDPGSRQEALGAGAMAMLSKPFTDSVLLQLASEALRHSDGTGSNDSVAL